MKTFEENERSSSFQTRSTRTQGVATRIADEKGGNCLREIAVISNGESLLKDI
jgi:hypothetical protein